jgi:hypothetical protein
VDVNETRFTDVLLESALLDDCTARWHEALTLTIACRQPRLLRWFESAAPQIKVVPTLEDALPATTPP